MEETMNRKRLGRGLGALIPEKKETSGPSDGITAVPVDEIAPNRYQPRTVFNEGSLRDLAASIKLRGVIQPIIVSKKRNGYELVAGERRWRAVKSLGYKEIPAIVKVMRDSDSLELALIENIQRENLNPIEEAQAYERLMNEYALTQEELSKRVGKSRSTVANLLRLLKLPDRIRDDLSDGRLSMGHARALLAIESDEEKLRLREQIIDMGMNVRETEKGAKTGAASKSKKSGATPPADIFI